MVVTPSDCPVTSVHVLPPTLSDYSFVSVNVNVQSRTTIPACRRQRHWRSFDIDGGLRQSVLLMNAPDDCSSLVEYNSTLQSLLDRHALFAFVKPRAHINAPWYDRQCRSAKAATRRLERAYRQYKSESNRAAWNQQSKLLLSTLRRRYTDYWSNMIADNANDSKALWSRLNVLLKTTQQSSSAAHSATDFADFFRSKVEKIRAETATAPSPVVIDRASDRLFTFDDVTLTADEIIKLVGKASEHCSLDPAEPAPTWLIKRVLPLLADTFGGVA